MKVVARLIDLIAARCIQQCWHFFSGRHLSQSNALSHNSTECLPPKLDVDNDGPNVLPPR
ncbi:hypothetical protein ACVWW6_008824 [Bradyrhizobium sp. USDA 3311]|uniref:hypothetical protein n=1 Tax=Bradyrhizobium TaxID=374 RepID=UPI001177DCC1|nr:MULTISPECIES: hypothetical protein [Bradyrhizobium]QHP73102.1 hypothetical protein EI171_41090 [Bradyrhizobium sp. LCT2]